MEMRVITALYAYPQLERMSKDYEEHIKNRALLSYKNRTSTEKLTEYLAMDIVRRQCIEQLKDWIDKVISVLSEEERALLDIRYFGRADRIKRVFAAAKAGLCKMPFKPWSERNYYRKQDRVLKRVVALLKAEGLDEKTFDEEYLEIEYIALLYQYVCLGKEVGSKKERQLLCFLNELK